MNAASSFQGRVQADVLTSNLSVLLLRRVSLVSTFTFQLVMHSHFTTNVLPYAC